jgi:hypothetical protein
MSDVSLRPIGAYAPVGGQRSDAEIMIMIMIMSKSRGQTQTSDTFALGFDGFVVDLGTLCSHES